MQIMPLALPGSASSTALGSCMAPACSLSGKAASAAASLASRQSPRAACRSRLCTGVRVCLGGGLLELHHTAAPALAGSWVSLCSVPCALRFAPRLGGAYTLSALPSKHAGKHRAWKTALFEVGEGVPERCGERRHRCIQLGARHPRGMQMRAAGPACSPDPPG